MVMRFGHFLTSKVLSAALILVSGGAFAFNDADYPDWKGQWTRLPVPGITGAASFDPTKGNGLAQRAPLTPEYQKVFEATIAEQAAGGHGPARSHLCIPSGMPMVMNVYEAMELIISGDTTHITVQSFGVHRRIYTDGRDWPAEITPSYLGYSIGKWIDADGDGKFDTLEVETRRLKGPRVFDPTGLPLHLDDQTVVKERLYLDKDNRNTMHNDITVFDHALTQPWSANKHYRRFPNPQPVWEEFVCEENNPHVRIGGEDYMLGADGLLMPAKKDQRPPDLRYFNQTQR
jgi:hypothetical protein